jgi:aspartyl-tRNA(Asn)/glutamyl-tRNA(Gln) amidotransferase subunit A
LPSPAGDPYNAVITWVESPADPRPGPLAGKTLLVKDLIDTAGIRMTYGSKIYAEHVPARTAPAAQRLLDAGATLIGKANLHEFAWGVTSQNPWYGTVKNPARPGTYERRLERRERRRSRCRAV